MAVPWRPGRHAAAARESPFDRGQLRDVRIQVLLERQGGGQVWSEVRRRRSGKTVGEVFDDAVKSFHLNSAVRNGPIDFTRGEVLDQDSGRMYWLHDSVKITKDSIIYGEAEGLICFPSR